MPRFWNIVLQNEILDREPCLVPCKQIRHFPVENKLTGKTELRRLPKDWLIFQVIVQSDGEQHRVKISKCGRSLKFVWQQPDHMEHPTLKIGLGKSGNRFTDTRRKIVDTLAPKQRVAGNKAEFSIKADFIEHLTRILGEQLAAEVLGHLAQAFSI